MQHSHSKPKKIGPHTRAGTSDIDSMARGSVQRIHEKTAIPIAPAMKWDGLIPSMASRTYEGFVMRTPYNG